MRRWKRWTVEEVTLLKIWWVKGLTRREIGSRLGKSYDAVGQKVKELNALGLLPNKNNHTGSHGGLIARDTKGIIDGLKVVRKARGLPSRDVDEIAGIAAGYTSKLEAGMRGPGPQTLDRLMDALDVALIMVPKDLVRD
jgi:hypothetical protein